MNRDRRRTSCSQPASSSLAGPTGLYELIVAFPAALLTIVGVSLLTGKTPEHG